MSAIAQALILLPLSLDASSGAELVTVDSSRTVWTGEELVASPFLTAARQGIIPVLEKLGTGLYAVKVDIAGNIDRLENSMKHLGSDGLLYNIVTHGVRNQQQRAHGQQELDKGALVAETSAGVYV